MSECAPPYDFRVRVDGRALTLVRESMRAITVWEEVDAVGMFALTLYDWDEKRLRYGWSDGRQFAPGAMVEIFLGERDDVQPVILGEVTGLEPHFAAGEAPTLLVRGHDHGHRLLRGLQTRSFQKMKDSDIARQIARANGLRAEVRATPVSHPYVLQHNESDMAFLRSRAERLGYELYVREKVLHFHPPRHDRSPALTLSLNREIVEFSPRLTTMTQPAEVAVQGWDPQRKQAVAATAGAGREATRMGGARTGPQAARRAFGAGGERRVRQAVSNPAEAQAMAEGQFERRALAYISGDALCHGNPRLRAGTVVEIADAGERFSGRYYLTGVIHRLFAGRGYQTELRLQRNAS